MADLSQPFSFGTPATGQTTTSTSSGNNLFGGFGAQSGSAGGAFGSTNKTSAAGGTGFGGLFGQSQGQVQAQAQGQSAAAGQSQGQNTFGQPSAPKNLFGQPSSQQGLFGPLSGQPGQGLFGQQTSQTGPSSHLFGASSSTPAQGGFSFGTAGQPTSLLGSGSGNPSGGQGQPPASQPTGSLFGQTPSHPPPVSAQGVSATTRFNDLSDDPRKVVEQIQSFIQGRQDIKRDIVSLKSAAQITTVCTQLSRVKGQLAQVSSILTSHAGRLETIKGSVEVDTKDLYAMTRAIDEFRDPVGKGSWVKNTQVYSLDFFFRLTETLEEKLVHVERIIQSLPTDLDDSRASLDRPSSQALASVIKSQYTTFMSLASQVAQLDAEVRLLKDRVRDVLLEDPTRMYGGRDPFQSGKGDLSLVEMAL